MQSAIYESVVTHQRFRPMRHRLRYRVYSLLLDLDEIDEIAATVPVFSRNSFNLFSFHDRDHGPRDGTDLGAWFDALAARNGVDLSGGSHRILVFPRVLGYTFNPLTMWFGHDRDGALRIVLYEVHNTFGQQHCYAAVVPEGLTDLPLHVTPKRFHVSPFLDRTGAYEMHLSPPAESYRLSIRLVEDQGPLLFAGQTGTRTALTTRSLLRQFFTKPLLTLKVIGGIHVEALKMWRKGAKYRRVPAPFPDDVDLASWPTVETTYSV